MSKYDSPLDNLKIASPCSMSWNEMYGDDRKRFCGDCKLNVYNLSGMSRDEAERLLVNSEGSVCVRYYRRADGSILTVDCPVGRAKLRQRLSVYTTAAFSLVFSFIAGMFVVSLFSRSNVEARRIPIIFATPTPEPTMGAISIRPTETPEPVEPAELQMGRVAPSKESPRPLKQMLGQISVSSVKKN